MLEQNRPELEKAGVLWWHNQGFKGAGSTWAILDDGRPFNNQLDNIEMPLGTTDDTGHGSGVIPVFHEVAPDAKVIYMPSVPRSIDYILANGIKLVSVSRGFYGSAEYFKPLLGKVLLLAAVGNEGDEAIYPAAYPEAIAVGAYSEILDKPSFYSNPGADITAFSEIWIKNETDQDIKCTGTSFSTPFAAGMVAIYDGWCRSQGYEPTIEELQEFIFNHCVDVYTPGFDLKTGRGLFVLPKEFPKVGEDMKIVLKVGSNTATKDGETVDLLATPLIQDGRVYLPVRDIGNLFDCKVDYISTTKEVVITK